MIYKIEIEMEAAKLDLILKKCNENKHSILEHCRLQNIQQTEDCENIVTYYDKVKVMKNWETYEYYLIFEKLDVSLKSLI